MRRIIEFYTADNPTLARIHPIPKHMRWVMLVVMPVIFVIGALKGDFDLNDTVAFIAILASMQFAILFFTRRVRFDDVGIHLYTVWQYCLPSIFGPTIHTWGKIRRARLYKSNEDPGVVSAEHRLQTYNIIRTVCVIYSDDPHYEEALRLTREHLGDRYSDVSRSWWRWFQ